MFGNVTPEQAVAFIRRTVALTFCWPLPSTATKHQVYRFKALRLLMVLSAFALFLPLLYGIYVHRDDLVDATKVSMLFFAVIQIILQILCCTVQYDRLQRLTDQIPANFKTMKSYERSVFQRYVDKYSKFYGVSSMWFYLTAFTYIMGALFVPQPFPTLAEYPFPVYHEPLKSIIFLHQSFVCIQCASHVNMNMFGAMLLLFAAARLEILSMELRNADNIHALFRCVKKYYAIRRYALEAVAFFQYIALTTVLLSILSLMIFGFFLIGRQPLLMKVQLLLLVVTALLEVFMCAWPADDLMDISKNVMDGAYESTWYQQTLEMQKNVVCALIPQRPVTISIKCVIPVLSLNYYCSYISNAFSMFAALRVVMGDKDEV